MNTGFYSYLSSKLQSEPYYEKGGYGIFANQPIQKGELLVMWGGRIITQADLDPTIPQFTQRVLQIEDGLYLYDPLLNDPTNSFNHSCDPNAGLSGQISLIAMRDIDEGEEVTFDYAMCDDADYDEFECACGSPNCRGRVSGRDWTRPELQRKYDGYFSPYLQRRINERILLFPKELEAIRIGS